jgi:hypothetical protein
MPGLTNRRRAIQEGVDWTKSKTKGYKGGGMVKVGTGSGYVGQISDPIAKTQKTQKPKKTLRRR